MKITTQRIFDILLIISLSLAAYVIFYVGANEIRDRQNKCEKLDGVYLQRENICISKSVILR